MSIIPPPLPPSLLPTILPLLLPPHPPLPTSLISKPLLQRHHFLPPSTSSTSNLDAHLTPYPTSTNNITTTLETLSTTDWVQNPVQYAHDGEYWLARCLIHSQFGDDGDGVEVVFIFEDSGVEGGGQGRGWVYHACALPGMINTHLVFYSSPDAVPSISQPSTATSNADNSTASSSTIPYLDPNLAQEGDDPQTIADYWAGFTPPHTETALPATTPALEDGDEEYWKQYNLGDNAGGAQTPGGGVSRGGSVLDFSGLGLQAHNGVKEVPDVVDLSVNDEAGEEQTMTMARRETGDSILREKVKGRIKLVLRDTWSAFSSSGQVELQDVLEERAHAWLALGRGVAFIPSKQNGGHTQNGGSGDDRSIKATARLEVLHDMWEVLGELDGDQGFWRLIEGTITQAVKPEVERRDSDLYWES